ncbi:NiFe-hydrogenase III large subunit [Elusimicrobium minutum Pei191]|uniref:NiFe-hydrogenase III large subunit n=1 Tax=Elusimicrobium minutum (strain Pei191) TaxID=445932 RepID=B2KDT6_ELUMP|nr:nickel-dependent hydrogenase large subunit [Elusimicrobium minutum]ACC98682.1 NiFe-hydrogenase III large subunit [Elusimicrobium minutum Pei191]
MPKITVPLGPQHPALKEPGNFMLLLEGEQIVDATLRLGYNHRGVEKAAESRNYLQAMYLIERVCGICSHSHATCYVMNVEEIAGAEVPKRAQAIRVIIGELERLHSHLLWLGVAAHEIGFDTLFMYSWRDRESVMDALETISGNRVHYSINTIGGVRRDITPEMVKTVLMKIEHLEKRVKYYISLATEEPTVIARTKGVGHLPKEEALRRCAAGPLARASGIARDVRKDDPYLIYGELDFKVITSDACDVFGRLYVRAFEMLESCRLLKQVLNWLPEGAIKVNVPVKIPAGHAVNRYEAPRGEDVHYVKSDGGLNPARVKVRAPTLANFESVDYMLRGDALADAALIIAAIDPCFSCTDRATIISPSLNSVKTIDWKDMRAHGIEYYKKKGIDFSKVKVFDK